MIREILEKYWVIFYLVFVITFILLNQNGIISNPKVSVVDETLKILGLEW